MNITALYYLIKPMVPRKTQIFMRRSIAARKIKKGLHSWPISPTAGKLPEGWKGWPDGKKFALVVLHDVDSIKGLANCMRLADLDVKMGVRSSFNFVPEDYGVPSWFRERLEKGGFEVGVHGLTHDGKTFLSRRVFDRRAPLINGYLSWWRSVGLVPPAMIRNLDWMPELAIEWSCSTFDTDPFEPQSGDTDTIFPYFVCCRQGKPAFVDLPYTLPQDHCLYVILEQKDNRIWKDKLDWLAAKGGLALVNVHPDYLDFGGQGNGFERYPVSYYLDFLEYVMTRYKGSFWNPLPREMARFWRENYAPDNRAHILKEPAPDTVKPFVPAGKPAKIWIDLDNTPHVPFFIPIIKELEKHGHRVVLTARDAFQVCELADKKGLKYKKIGRHYGKNPFKKVFGLFIRSSQLIPFMLKERPDLALSHGARSQILLSNLFGIPTLLIADYEHSRTLSAARALWLIIPESLLGAETGITPARTRYYRGIKEDVYAPSFRPDPGLMAELGLDGGDIIVTVRPPADEAHYYNPESTVLFLELMERLTRTPGVRAVMLPRNSAQEKKCREENPAWFAGGKTMIPEHAVDGLDMLWFSDLVVSGGGTMNREAAALGVPVYSIFRGLTGKVDEMLEREGRLVMIRSKEEVWSRIAITRRDKTWHADTAVRPALNDIVGHVEDILAMEAVGRRP